MQGCISYLWHVGGGQLSIICNRKKISEVLKERKVELETRAKLNLIFHTRNFAQRQLGLKGGQSYTYYTHLDRDYVAYNVTAADKLAFKPYTWYFPIAGRVPYKGYFDKQKAMAEAQCLAEDGYDSRISRVSAYSTLGWFDDPVLSPFLKQGDSQIIALIFHEMAHGTLYIKSDTLFNESFASFVEEKATIRYLEKFYDQEMVDSYKASLIDFRLYLEIMMAGANKLEALYASKISEGEKLEQKKKIIADLKRVGRATAFANKNYLKLFERDLNNTHFLSLRRYHSGNAIFEKIYLQKNKDMAAFIAELRSWKKHTNAERLKLLTQEMLPKK